MKIERFLLWLEHHLLNYPDIDMRTVKRIIDRFGQCLSPKEFETFHLYLEVLNDITSKQISIDSIVNQVKVENLEKELQKLRDD